MPNLRSPGPGRRVRCSRCEEWKSSSEFYGKKTISSMCKPCYSATYNHDYRQSLQLRKRGDFSEPMLVSKKERIEDGQGRIHVYKPDHPLANTGRDYPGYVLEHRMVAWDAGLLTDPALQVRHINKIPSDNRLENLKVSSAEPKKTRICQSCGKRFPMKLTICNDCRVASRVAQNEKTVAERALLDRVSSMLPSAPSKEIGNELFNYVHIYTSRHLTTKLEKLFFAYSLDAVSAALKEISNELKTREQQPEAVLAEFALLIEEARKLAHQRPEPKNKLTAAMSARKN